VIRPQPLPRTPGARPLPPARQAALAALAATLPLDGARAQDVQAALDKALRPLEDPRDKSMATELVYGFLRFKSRLDHLVRRHLSKPDGTPLPVKRVLALGAYELLHLTAVPPHATLSWTVDAARACNGEGAAKLANAVMRRIQALGPDAVNPDFYRATTRDRVEFLAAWHACPPWIVRLWLEDYPLEAQKLLDEQTLPPFYGLRVNRAKDSDNALFCELRDALRPAFAASPWLTAPHGLPAQLTARLDALQREGRISRQSAAAGSLLASLGMETWDGPVWDCCAGRGGKTFALLEAGRCPVWASDANRARLAGLPVEAARLGLAAPPAFVCDAGTSPLRRPPRVILVDAPCTGLGVLTRRPDTKWKRTFADIGRLAAAQRRILHACLKLLKPGGALAYITCTLTRRENDEQAKFLESQGLQLVEQAVSGFEPDLREHFWGGLWKKK